jgi:hypothetical protein
MNVLEQVVRMEEDKTVFVILTGKPTNLQERDSYERLSIEGRSILE